jgi:hypothetical protein
MSEPDSKVIKEYPGSTALAAQPGSNVYLLEDPNHSSQQDMMICITEEATSTTAETPAQGKGREDSARNP